MAKIARKKAVVVPPAEKPAVVEVKAPASPPAAEGRKFLGPGNFERLRERAPKILKQILGSLGNTVRLEAEGAIPEAERLEREADGTVAWAAVERLITAWEEKNGGEGSAAYLLTKEARDYYLAEKLWKTLPHKELVEITGKKWGNTLDDLMAAAKSRKEQDAAYQQLRDHRDDGPEAICVRCAAAGMERKFQPTTSYIVVNGVRLTYGSGDRAGQPIRTGNFQVRKNNGGVFEVVAFCHGCNKTLRDKAKERGVRVHFDTRDEATARLERLIRGVERVKKSDSFDEALFAEEAERRQRKSRRDDWGKSSQRGGSRERSRR